jgi:hypothetical protein
MIVAGGIQPAAGWELGQLNLAAHSARQQLRGVLGGDLGLGQGRYTSLAARQDLRDEVCIAMSDGRLSPDERQQILSDAKRVLKPQEYAAFKQSLEQRSPARKTAKRTLGGSTPSATTSAARSSTPRARSSSPPDVATVIVVKDPIASSARVR